MTHLPKAAIIDAYQAGASITEIARKFGASRGGVQGIVSRAGIPLRGKAWDYAKHPIVGKAGDELYRQGYCRECCVPCFGKVRDGQPPAVRNICGDCQTKTAARRVDMRGGS